jgi:hypothetical protein
MLFFLAFNQLNVASTKKKRFNLIHYVYQEDSINKRGFSLIGKTCDF